MSASFEGCVLAGRGLCDELITRPEESIECNVADCDLETSIMNSPWPIRAVELRNNVYFPFS